MKNLYKALGVLSLLLLILTQTSFTGKNVTTPAAAYVITLVSTETAGANQVWTWTVYNPSPGNGENGTLQDISHWSLPLCPAAEAALVSAQYSYDGNTWFTVGATMDRDPSIRTCTSNDVLKFEAGTTGTSLTYYRLTFNKSFTVDPMAVSYIKTGGGIKGCNVYIYPGVGCYELSTAPRND
jgi:hypothetical protein